MANYRTWRELRDERLARPEARRAFDEAQRDIVLGKLIRALRESKEFTQAALAERMDSTQSVVARLEAGARTPSLDTLQRTAEALGEDLVVGFEDETRGFGRLHSVTVKSDESEAHDRVQLTDYVTSGHFLGLVIGDLRNPFYSDIAAAVEEVAREHNYLLTIASSGDDSEKEQRLLRSLCERGIDGLLVIPAPGTNHRFLLSEFHMERKVVFIDRPPVNIDADFLVTDSIGGAREATQHLLEQDHERIAILTDMTSIFTASQRLEGYKEALTAHRIPYDKELVRVDCRTSSDAQKSVQELLSLSSPPTAFFAGNNLITIGAMRALRETQPRSALVGFDDFELADMLSLTVVDQRPKQLGYQAAELLCERLSGATYPAQHPVLPTVLIPRGSGEIPVMKT